jgi:hypothetical protein
MAGENATQFLERLSNDASFRAELQTINTGKITDIMDFALSKDFVFTEQDLRQALANFQDSPIIEKLRTQLKVAKAARTA